MNEEKLHNIEATIAHQDQQIQDLSEMVTKQWDETPHVQNAKQAQRSARRGRW